MPFVQNYLARVSSSGNIDAGKYWVYDGTSTGSNEPLATISADGYFNAAQVTLKAVFAVGSTGTTGSLAVSDIIQINGNDTTGVFVVTSVTNNVTLAAQSGGGGITGATSLGGTYPIYAGQSGSTLQFNGINLGSGLTGSISGGALNLAASGGGGFAYENAFWVSQANGSDSNAGTSIDTPFATYQKALNSCPGEQYSVIYGVDGNNYNTETLVTPNTTINTTIIALGTSFNGSLTISSQDVVNIYAYQLSNVTNNSVNGTYGGTFYALYNIYNFIDSTTDAKVYVETPGTIYGFENTNQASYGTIIKCSDIIGAMGTCSGVVASSVSITATGAINYNGSSVSISALSLTGNYSNGIQSYLFTPGIISNVAFSNSSITTVTCAGSSSITNDGTAWVNGILGGTILPGFASNAAINGTLGFSTGSAINYTQTNSAPTGANQTLLSSGAGPGATTSWGNVATNFDYVNTYWVSQANGNDANAGTSINTPFATFQAAITAIANGTGIIYGVDANNANYETIATTNTAQEITIFAPGTNFFGTWTINSADSVTINCLDFNSLSATTSISGSLFANCLTFGNAKFANAKTSIVNSSLTQGTIEVQGFIGNVYLNITTLESTLALASSSVVYLNTMYLNGTVTNDGTCYLNNILNGTLGGFSSASALGGTLQDGVNGFVTATISATGNFTNLGSAGQVNLITAISGASYVITEMYMNYGGTNFAGGDRNLAITDGTTVYSLIPSTSLASLPNNERWGGLDLPYPASDPINQPTLTSESLYLIYSGGTTDYTSGSVTITIVYARVA